MSFVLQTCAQGTLGISLFNKGSRSSCLLTPELQNGDWSENSDSSGRDRGVRVRLHLGATQSIKEDRQSCGAHGHSIRLFRLSFCGHSFWYVFHSFSAIALYRCVWRMHLFLKLKIWILLKKLPLVIVHLCWNKVQCLLAWRDSL